MLLKSLHPSRPERSIDSKLLPAVLRSATTQPASGAVIMFLAVFALFGVVAHTSGFLTLSATATYIATATNYAIIAAPVSLLMMAGEFDLSVSAVVALGAMTVAITTVTLGWPLWAGTLLALTFGALVGMANGLLVTKTKLHSFIVTLATQFVLEGTVLAGTQGITGTTTVNGPQLQAGPIAAIFNTPIGKFSTSSLIALASIAMFAWVQVKTRFGNWVLAVGGDLEAAKRAGIPTAAVKHICFVACGVCASIVGINFAISFGSAETVYGQNYELTAIVAAVIGGTLLTGGRGSVIGSGLGALTFGLIQQGIFYAGWNTYLFDAFLGGLLLLAVLLNENARRLGAQRHPAAASADEALQTLQTTPSPSLGDT